MELNMKSCDSILFKVRVVETKMQSEQKSKSSRRLWLFNLSRWWWHFPAFHKSVPQCAPVDIHGVKLKLNQFAQNFPHSFLSPRHLTTRTHFHAKVPALHYSLHTTHCIPHTALRCTGLNITAHCKLQTAHYVMQSALHNSAHCFEQIHSKYYIANNCTLHYTGN